MKPSYVPKSLRYVYDFSAEMPLKQTFRHICAHAHTVPHMYFTATIVDILSKVPVYQLISQNHTVLN